MDELKLNQDILRNALLQEVKHYCGYADDVHDDYIIVNESTFEVDYHSNLDYNHKEGYRYYSLSTLVKMKDFCFIPMKPALKRSFKTYILLQRCKTSSIRLSREYQIS